MSKCKITPLLCCLIFGVGLIGSNQLYAAPNATPSATEDNPVTSFSSPKSTMTVQQFLDSPMESGRAKVTFLRYKVSLLIGMIKKEKASYPVDEYNDMVATLEAFIEKAPSLSDHPLSVVNGVSGRSINSSPLGELYADNMDASGIDTILDDMSKSVAAGKSLDLSNFVTTIHASREGNIKSEAARTLRLAMANKDLTPAQLDDLKEFAAKVHQSAGDLADQQTFVIENMQQMNHEISTGNYSVTNLLKRVVEAFSTRLAAAKQWLHDKVFSWNQPDESGTGTDTPPSGENPPVVAPEPEPIIDPEPDPEPEPVIPTE